MWIPAPKDPEAKNVTSCDTSIAEFTPEGTESISEKLLANANAAIDISAQHREPRLPCYVINLDQAQLFFGRADVFRELDQALLPPSIEMSGCPEGSQSRTHPRQAWPGGHGFPVGPPPRGRGSGQRRTIRTFSLCGVGGIGKTEASLQYALSRKERFDAVFWIPAETEANILGAFSEIAASFHLITQEEAMDTTASKNALLSWLSRPLKNPREYLERESAVDDAFATWLLVFDNVVDISLLRQYMPNGGPGSVLITSRDPLAKNFHFPNAGITLQGLEEESAETLLRKLTYENNLQEDSTSARALVKRLDCLPIAILHAAGVINGQDLTFREFLERYERDIGIHGEEISRLAQVHVGSYAHTLGTVWALEGLDEQARALFNLLSLLGSPIQESLLEQQQSRVTLAAFPSATDYVDARSKLGRSYLITRDKHSKSISCHPVTQDVARQSMETEVFRDTFALGVTLVNIAWGVQEEKFGHRASDWQISDKLVPHAIKLYKHFQNYQPDVGESVRLSFITLLARASA